MGNCSIKDVDFSSIANIIYYYNHYDKLNKQQKKEFDTALLELINKHPNSPN